MTKTQKSKQAYREGVADGYFGNPPEYRFLNLDRSPLERERWSAGHSDGAALRDLDREQNTLVGYQATVDLVGEDRAVSWDGSGSGLADAVRLKTALATLVLRRP